MKKQIEKLPDHKMVEDKNECGMTFCVRQEPSEKEKVNKINEIAEAVNLLIPQKEKRECQCDGTVLCGHHSSMKHTDLVLTSTTYTTMAVCKHENGWYDSIDYFFYTRKVFCCSDCYNIIKIK